ncbi:MAG: hypothetical protein ACE361_14415 [Aureliella sp.]
MKSASTARTIHFGAERVATAIILLLVGFVCAPSAALASGCDYRHGGDEVLMSGASSGRIASFYWWTQGPVIRVYENGRFSYYQAPTKQSPCEGPDCRGTPSKSTFQEVAINTSDSNYSASPLFDSFCSVVPPRKRDAFGEFSTAYCMPHLAISTRPPIVR